MKQNPSTATTDYFFRSNSNVLKKCTRELTPGTFPKNKKKATAKYRPTALFSIFWKVMETELSHRAHKVS